ncbi:hypothetical protein ACOSQ3_007192 [Xanthoceras sorbifolium]
MGSNDHGRVRLFGTGTTSSNGVGQNSTVDEIRAELDELRSNYHTLQSRYEKLESNVMSRYETCPQTQSRSEQVQDNSSAYQPHPSSSGHRLGIGRDIIWVEEILFGICIYFWICIYF